MGTKGQNVKSLRTREFVEDNRIWVAGFVVGFFWGFFGFGLVLVLFFFKHSDRDYYKELRGKWHFITIPLAISGSSPLPSSRNEGMERGQRPGEGGLSAVLWCGWWGPKGGHLLLLFPPLHPCWFHTKEVT